MKLSKAFEGFTIARISEGMSPGTAENYSYPMMKLINHLGDPDIGDVAINDLRSFLHWYATDYTPNRYGGNTKPLSPASVDIGWKAIRSLFRWLHEEYDLPRPDIRQKRRSFKTPPKQPFTFQ